MLNPPIIETRCANGRPCEEITARLVAGHVAKYHDGDVAVGEQLIAAAQRWAAAHRYGSTVLAELEEVG